MNKRIITITILAVILSGLFAYSFPNIGKSFSSLPEEHKHLWTAIAVSGIGLTILFLKKIKELTEEMYATAELFEILMFMIIPVFTSFEILKTEIKMQPLLIPIIFLSAIFIWFVIALQYIHKKFKREGKLISFYVIYFFSAMLILGVFITILIMWYLSLTPSNA